MISVIIPTCNRPDLLARCLDRLAPAVQTLPADQYEVIVTDDGEPTVERFLAESYPWVIWKSGPRWGPGANRNAGTRHASGTWIAFTDDDCVPDANWLATFTAATHAGCSVYEGKTTCLAGIHSPLDHAPLNITGGCLWSCNMFIDRCAFEAVEGFNERYPFLLEDVDLRERLIRAGYMFEFVPAAVVDHPPRRLASARTRARNHEAWVYYWYKRGNRTMASPRLLNIITQGWIRAIGRYRLGGDTFRAIGSAMLEVSCVLLRLPFWEYKYRWRFRTN